MTRLADRLACLGEELTPEEREAYKIMLAMAASELGVAQARAAVGAGVRQAFDVTVEALTLLQPHRELVARAGLVYSGRPDFLTDELLDSLIAEAQLLRPGAQRVHDHFVTKGGDVARATALSTDLHDLITAAGSPVIPTARANYTYYDEPGLGIDPHVDTPDFSINAITMLDHRRPRGHDRSALVLYLPGSEPRRFQLSPGEMVVFYADSITHARERMRVGESVTVAAFGFQPLRTSGRTSA